MNKSKGLLHSVWFWVGVFIAVLVLVRLALPYAIKSYMNKELDDIAGFHGSVEDVSLSILRGAYEVDGIKLVQINEKTGKAEQPFLSVEAVALALDWDALFQRRLLSSIKIFHPVVIVNNIAAKDAEKKAKEASAEKKTQEPEVPWQTKVQSLYPIDINEFSIADGSFRFEDLSSSPQIDVAISAIDLEVRNISNTLHSAAHLPTDVALNAKIMHSGEFKATAKANLLIDPPEADVKAALRGFKLAQINDITRAYGDFDFKNGDFDVTAEVAASKTRYEGYVKTLAKNIELLNWKEERAQGKSVKHLLWEGLLAVVVDVFKNHHQNQFAARIPLSGPRADLKIDKWATVGSILRNGFVKALSPRFEDSVKFSDVSANPAEAKAKTKEPPAPKP